MSSILKALKKLEEEKAAKSGNGADIAGAILKTGRRGKQKPRWLVPASMLAIAVVAVLATYAVMGGFSPRRQVVVVTPPPATPTPPPQSVVTSPAPPAPSPVQPLRVETRLPTPLPQTVGKAAPPAPPATTPRKSVMEEDARPAVPTPQKATVGPGKGEDTPHPSPPLPVLIVSGIAWQKDSSSRLAVVNGTSVTQGAMVGGARVEEIFPDRVRFSLENHTVEVPLGKTAGDGR